MRGPFTNQPLYVICGLALWNVSELQDAFEGFELTEDPPFTANTHRLPEVWQQTQFVPVTFNQFFLFLQRSYLNPSWVTYEMQYLLQSASSLPLSGKSESLISIKKIEIKKWAKLVGR